MKEFVQTPEQQLTEVVSAGETAEMLLAFPELEEQVQEMRAIQERLQLRPGIHFAHRVVDGVMWFHVFCQNADHRSKVSWSEALREMVEAWR